MLIHNKDDIELVTEYPCFLGHPVRYTVYSNLICKIVTIKFNMKLQGTQCLKYFANKLIYLNFF